MVIYLILKDFQTKPKVIKAFGKQLNADKYVQKYSTLNTPLVVQEISISDYYDDFLPQKKGYKND